MGKETYAVDLDTASAREALDDLSTRLEAVHLQADTLCARLVDLGEIGRKLHGLVSVQEFDPERSHAEALEAWKDSEARTDGALAALVRLGHTEHCARSMAWGDGSCECCAAANNNAKETADA